MWYITLYNSSPNYMDTLHCTQEVVTLCKYLRVYLSIYLQVPTCLICLAHCCPVFTFVWYTMLCMYNPSPNYMDTLHCTQEVVYPLQVPTCLFVSLSDLWPVCLSVHLHHTLCSTSTTPALTTWTCLTAHRKLSTICKYLPVCPSFCLWLTVGLSAVCPFVWYTMLCNYNPSPS